MKNMKEEKKCPCEQCVYGTYMIVEKEWWCDKHLKYASQMERNHRCEKFETISGDENEMEIGCWNCAISGIKDGKPVCPECGTEIAPLCKEYSHKKIRVVVK